MPRLEIILYVAAFWGIFEIVADVLLTDAAIENAAVKAVIRTLDGVWISPVFPCDTGVQPIRLANIYSGDLYCTESCDLSVARFCLALFAELAKHQHSVARDRISKRRRRRPISPSSAFSN